MSTAIQGDGTVSKDGGTGTDLLAGLIKAWCSFDHSGSAGSLEYDSLNVSSYTDSGVGDHEVNFTNAFASATGYCVTSGGGSGSIGNPGDCIIAGQPETASKLDGTARNSSNTKTDRVYIMYQITGDLA